MQEHAVAPRPLYSLHRVRYGSLPALHSCPSPALHHALSDRAPGYARVAARRSRATTTATQNDRKKDKSENFPSLNQQTTLKDSFLPMYNNAPKLIRLS